MCVGKVWPTGWMAHRSMSVHTIDTAPTYFLIQSLGFVPTVFPKTTPEEESSLNRRKNMETSSDLKFAFRLVAEHDRLTPEAAAPTSEALDVSVATGLDHCCVARHNEIQQLMTEAPKTMCGCGPIWCVVNFYLFLLSYETD